MIQYIGLMVGYYILTKMVRMLFTPGEQNVTKVFAAIGILVTLFFMLGIMASWATVPEY